MKTAEDIKKTLGKYIRENEKKIELWEHVQRVHKKDGSDFANFGKNFTGCKVEQKSYSDDKDLVVSDWAPGFGYVQDGIGCRQLVKYSTLRPAEDRIQKIAYLEPFFYITPDEAEVLIKERIEKLRSLNADYQYQLDQADEVFSRFKYAIDNALQDLKDRAGKNSVLYYEAREYMKAAY